MKGKPSFYYCLLDNGTQTKNKLQAEFSEFLREMEGDLYQASDLDKIKRYIIKKAKEFNKEYPRCKALDVSFEQYSKENHIHYLCGIEFNTFRLMPAYFVKLKNDL